MSVNVTATDQIKSDRGTKTILVTRATGDTGRPTVKLLLERGHKVKALVHKDDERARTLRDQGADVVVGDMLDISSVRKAAAFACTVRHEHGRLHVSVQAFCFGAFSSRYFFSRLRQRLLALSTLSY